jgi:two-component sensor histidine kinase
VTLAPPGGGLAPAGERQLLSFPFRATPEAPGEARRRTSEVLASSPQLDVVLILVSELVTNAVLHTADGAELRVSQRDHTAEDVIRVEVQDRHRATPESPPTAGAHGGYGLRIVAAMARDWGCTPLPDGQGKIVWFEVGSGVTSPTSHD